MTPILPAFVACVWVVWAAGLRAGSSTPVEDGKPEKDVFRIAVSELLAEDSVIAGAAKSTTSAVKFKRVQDLLEEDR